MDLLLLIFLLLFLISYLRDTENRIIFEILDLFRLFLNGTFELLKLLIGRIVTFEIEEGRVAVRFN